METAHDAKHVKPLLSMPRLLGIGRYIAAWLCVFGVWLLVRPYMGIRNDSVLYTGQVLARLQPDIFTHDLFFAFGSQDSFTVYPRLLAGLFVRYPIGDTTIVLLFVTLLALWAGLVVLGRSVLDRQALLLGGVSLAVLPHLYGAQQIFGFAEPYLTARSVAEVLVVGALAAYFRHWRSMAVAMVVIAALLHPIIALPGITVLWMLFYRQHRGRCLVLAAGMIVAAVIAAFAGVAPFDRVSVAFDDSWLRILENGAIVFLTNWDWSDWNIVVTDLVALAICMRFATGALRTLFLAILAVTVGGLVISLVMTDGLHNVLFAQLQLWRSLWLAHLLVLFILPWLGKQLAADGKVVVFVLLVAGLLGAKHQAALAFPIVALIADRVRAVMNPLNGRYRWAIYLISGALVLRATESTTRALIAASSAVSADGWRVLLMCLSIPVFAFVLVWILLHLIDRLDSRIAVLAGCAVLAFGVATWDKRSDWQKYVENGSDSLPFAQQIAPGSQVYWENGLRETWFLLHRASYFSRNQLSGIAFNKGTAIEGLKRAGFFETVSLARRQCLAMAMQSGSDDRCLPSEELIYNLCVVAKDLDYMIWPDNTSGMASATWTPPMSIQRGAARQPYYLYDCKAIRTVPSESTVN